MLHLSLLTAEENKHRKGARLLKINGHQHLSELPGSLVGNSFPGNHGGLQTCVVLHPEHAVQNLEKASCSQPGISSMSIDNTKLHPHPTAVAPVLPSGVDLKMAGTNMQKQVVCSHNSHAEAQGWGSAGVPKPELQAWGGVSTQLNNPATMPSQPASHGPWGDASFVQRLVDGEGNQYSQVLRRGRQHEVLNVVQLSPLNQRHVVTKCHVNTGASKGSTLNIYPASKTALPSLFKPLDMGHSVESNPQIQRIPSRSFEHMNKTSFR
ncbi:unnamed protein product [Sphenostylis stenocarpa]|uniref:Uncharacterized protein n=1 Tax=Sphenostylis stenocarpa TaxID=92480 RepID=A0AA86S3Q0_9FABA|nr:unnamed protein product [Sphenostylis stenocarpa]